MISQPGRIEVICGSMFSGKTEELVRRIRRAQYARQKFQVFKPKIDNRYSSTQVQSHNSPRIDSLAIERSEEIFVHLQDRTRTVGIDEAQFFDDGIVEVCNRLANRGIRIIVAGLDLDYLGQPFGPMPQLMAVAEEVTKLHAVCMACGAPASRSQRFLGESNDLVQVGAGEHYEARCRHCHELESHAIMQRPEVQLEGPPTLA